MHPPSLIALPKKTGLSIVKFYLQWSLPGSELLVFAFSFPKTAMLSLLLLLNLLPSLADGRFMWKPYWLWRRHNPVHPQHWYKPAGVSRQARLIPGLKLILCVYILSPFETNVYLKLIEVRADTVCHLHHQRLCHSISAGFTLKKQK